MSRRKRKRDGLKSKVTRATNIQKDQYGHEYMPICTFKHHPGLIERPFVCETRNCAHYTRVYIQKNECDE